MDKLGVRAVLEQIAAYLQLQGENRFRVGAYRKAARAIATYPGNLAEALTTGDLAEVKGVGDVTLDIVKELVTTGRSELLETLREQSEPGLL
jgi:DNA polymerase (family 10)